MSQLNPKFKQSYAIAKSIGKRKNKTLAILAWCKAAKIALGGGK